MPTQQVLLGLGAAAVKTPMIVLMEAGTNIPVISTNGITYASCGHKCAGGSGGLSAAAYSPQLQLFVAMDSSAGDNTGIYTSPDGVFWTARTKPDTHNYGTQGNGVCWAAGLGLFIACATEGSVITSPDGINWTVRTTPNSNAHEAIVWAPELGLVVVVSANGTNRAITSPDGINWTERANTIDSEFEGLTWGAGAGLLVAVGDIGTSRIATSPDGINWTARTAPDPTTGAYEGVDWSPEQGIFVAVSRGGSARIISSPDGINWTSRTPPSVESWRNVKWSSKLGMFIACNTSSTTNATATSPDGINWTGRGLIGALAPVADGMAAGLV